VTEPDRDHEPLIPRPRYRLEFRPAAARQIRKLPHDTQKAIKDATDTLRSDPRPAGVIKLSGGGDLWRLRVGRYRVVYRIADAVVLVTVVKVALRDEGTYRGL
jgi:mRNA interferase RelE/StbE